MDQLREIDEAVRAADDALAYLRRAARSLGSARNYGVWDILGGGLIVTMLKHSKLDMARVEMENARDAMRRFSDELRDVEALPDVELDIGDFLTLADYFFDGFLADVMVQGRIRQAQEQVARAIRQVERIRDKLVDLR